MKKKDFTNPYATLGINKVTSPKSTAKDDPKSKKYSNGKDLRGGKG